MSEAQPKDLSEDSAWAGVDTALEPDAVLALLDDPERFLRVNSQWVFERWDHPAPDQFRLHIYNQSNGQSWSTAGKVIRQPEGLQLQYDDGIKAATRFQVEPAAEGARLWIIEDYDRLPEEERRARLNEVDRSLPRWAQDLHVYLRAWSRWSRFGPWRWYMERVWRPMRPLARRITRLLIWATVAEFVLFVGLILVFRLELGG